MMSRRIGTLIRRHPSPSFLFQTLLDVERYHLNDWNQIQKITEAPIQEITELKSLDLH